MKTTSSLVAVLVVAVCLSARLEALAHSAVESAPRTDRGWTDRQEQLNKRAAEAGEKAQVIFIGEPGHSSSGG